MTPLPCPHGMPNAAACVDCMLDGPVELPAEWEKIGGPFTAQHDGVCIGCDNATITAGQQVQRWDRGPNRTAYLHARCTP